MTALRDSDHAWKQAPHGSGTLIQFCESIVLPARPSDNSRKKYRTVLNHLTRFLGRSPSIEDLSSSNLRQLLSHLINAGRQQETILEVRHIVVAIASQARTHGVLSTIPDAPLSALPQIKTIVYPKVIPWSINELNQLIKAARTLPVSEGELAGIAAKRWWPALLLTLLDVGLGIKTLLEVPVTAFDARSGQLSAGLLKYTLSTLTIEALLAILPHGNAKLFAFPFDRAILYRRMKYLLYRADLPFVETNSFDRLRVTAQRMPDVVGQINLDSDFAPRNGKPRLPRARDRRRWQARDNRSPANRKPKPKAKKPKVEPERLYRISFPESQTLIHFANQSYIPLRMADAKEDSHEDHRRTIERFSEFLAYDAIFVALEDERVEQFLVWLRARHMPNVTVNKYRRCLLAMWRHAWRKKRVDDLPRDIARLKEPKRLPEAWSVQEVGQILRAAASTEGEICEISAGLWWIALILVLYDTGLRIKAALEIRIIDVDLETRWLKVPAENQKQAADQAFRLHEETVAVLRLMNRHRREWLFPWPFDPDSFNTLNDRYRRILTAAGLNAGRRDLFHKLRRTTATAVYSSLGLQAAQFHLGHSSSELTLKSYVDPTKIVVAETPADRMARPSFEITVS